VTDQPKVLRAELQRLDKNGKAEKKIPVQFNPETLKVSYANQVVPPTQSSTQPAPAKDDRGSASIQFVGRGTTKLSVQLWFDVTGTNLPQPHADATDVRVLTGDVVGLITPREESKDVFRPPAVRFLWGTFQFDGIMESLEESLEFFSAEGVPLRASLTLGLSQQGIEFAPPPKTPPSGAGAAAPGTTTPGTRPLVAASAGQTLQGLAASIGGGVNWQDIAAANGVDNPRLLQPGQLIDLNASVPATASASIGGSISFG
jgi:LysM repeat protein